jgi:hypothetical protein
MEAISSPEDENIESFPHTTSGKLDGLADTFYKLARQQRPENNFIDVELDI